MKNITCYIGVLFFLNTALYKTQQKVSEFKINFETESVLASEAVRGFFLKNNLKNIYPETALSKYKIQATKCNNESVVQCLNKILKGLPFETVLNNNVVIIRELPPSKGLLSPPPAAPLSKADTTRMAPDEKEIREVVINAGYYKVKDQERTGSIARVSAKEMENQPVTNALSAVQGRISGVNIVQGSGLAGGGFEIQIRGRNSLRYDGNYPLIIVDGVPLNAQFNSIDDLASGILPKGGSSPLNAVNPNDIESFEVLKDADATAIYGSRGANGVILITTKHGRKQKMAVELTLNTTISKAPKAIKFASTEQYLQMRSDAYKLDGFDALPANAYDINGTWDKNKYTDWYDTFIGKTFIGQSQQLAFSGGNEQTQFFLSLSHTDQGTAYARGFNYKRNSFNLSTTYSSSDGKFKITPGISYTIQNNNLSERDLTERINLAPNAPSLYMPDGKLNWENNTFENPLAKLENKYKAKINTFSARVLAEYEFLPTLKFRLNGGYTNTTQKEFRTSPSTQYNPVYGATSAYSVIYVGDVQHENWIVEPQIGWDKKIGRHTINLLAGTTFEQKSDQILQITGKDFSSNDLLYNLSNAKVQQITNDTEILYRYIAFYSRLNYNYDGRYIINLTARRDGSSRFGPNNRFSNFGAIGGAWIFSNEKFLKNISWFSFGKLRGSYGITGNDLIGDYQFLNTYTSTPYIYDGTIGIYPSRLYNPNFSWEKTTKLETAIELGFLKNRINVSFAWYRNRSSNQLVGYPLPGTTGFLEIQSNFPAKVQNTGTEVDVHSQIVKNSNFQWNASLNLSIPKSKLLAFDNLASTSYANTYVVGQPMNIRKVYQYKGINPETGVYEFADLNGDGKIDLGDREKVADFGIKYFGGISNEFRYKNLSLSFLLQFVKQKQFAYSYYAGITGIMMNVPEYMLDYWTPEHTNAIYQRPTTGSSSEAVNGYYLYQDSDASIVDASFIRLNNLQINYKIPFNGNDSSSLTLGLQAQNLFTITKYKGLDPQVQGTYLPTLKTYSLSAILKF